MGIKSYVYFSKTFFPYTTTLYDKLPYSIRKEREILEIKSRLKDHYKHKNVKHFNRGISKYANSLHTQLRLGRSLLAAHGFAIGLNDTNLCICSRPETTKHFFTCFIFQEEQKLLYETVSKQIANFSTYSLSRQVDIFLNGISSEPDPRNLPIVFAVQAYILQTKQFKQKTTQTKQPKQNNSNKKQLKEKTTQTKHNSN